MTDKTYQFMIDNTSYYYNKQFVQWFKDHEFPLTVDDLESAIDTWNEQHTEALFDSAHGQYVPALFAQMVLEAYEYKDDQFTLNKVTIKDIEKDDLELLADKKNLDFEVCEYYWDVWNTVLSNCEIVFNGMKWRLDQDGDLFMLSEHYIDKDI